MTGADYLCPGRECAYIPDGSGTRGYLCSSRRKLQDFAPGGGLQAGAHQEQHDDTAWIDVPVPGDAHSGALIAAGRLADPFYDRNEAHCTWMEGREWWYRLRLTVRDAGAAADERLLLILHGVDTFATDWLNGRKLGRSANMFRPAIFDLTGQGA